MANLGIRPTVGGTQRLLEVHLLDFEGNLYGEKLEITFGRMIRGEKRFQGHAELQKQIQQDLKEVRRLFDEDKAEVKPDSPIENRGD